MKIASLQWSGVWEESSSNIDSLRSQLIDIIGQGPQAQKIDIVVLPELFHTGFSMHPERFTSAANELLSNLAKLAGEFGIYLMAGVAEAEVDEEAVIYRNSGWVFTPSGQRSARYIKQMPFSYANEQAIYPPGNQPSLFELNGVTCSLFICYDLRFPELFRKVAGEAEVIFVIANWPESRQSHWETLLTARAIENQCFIVGVNRVGRDGNDLNDCGGSMVISPLGEVLSYGKANDEVIITDIETSQVQQVRTQFPFLQDMPE
ncbi:MAG: hypothetical protein PF440_05790 [Thiomicrorhabdus sp.]|nr:hypothetical protein [Thiomicrorhabdus sp.]